MGSPTLNLLKSSVFLSFSGAFTLYTASLVAFVEPRLLLCAGFSFVVYSVYTFDRSFGGAEDVVNRKDIVEGRWEVALLFVIFSLVVSILILFHEALFPLGALFPFLVGFLYSKGLNFGGVSLNLKGSMGGKNFVVALTWAGSVLAFLYYWVSFKEGMVIFFFIFMKLFINTVIYDCRDVVGDRATGVLTFPVVFGMRKTGRILQVLNLCLHGSLVVLVNLSVVKFPLVVLVFSGVIGFFYIWLFTRGEGSVSRSLEGNEWIRDVLVDGEWILIVGFREVIQFSCSPS